MGYYHVLKFCARHRSDVHLTTALNVSFQL